MNGNFKKSRTIGLYLLLLFYIGVGIFSIISAFMPYGNELFLIGALICVSSIISISLYFYKDGHKHHEKSFYLSVGLVSLSFGLLVIIARANNSSIITLDSACLCWAVLEVVKGALELTDSIEELKENKCEIIEMLVSGGDIIVGILLFFHRGEGLVLHLVYFGIAFILSALKSYLDYLNEKKSLK